jgi:branched-chain amino acid transport system substrate-binding protein
MASCKLAGLKTTQINSNIPYGGTDIGPIALQLKADNIDALYMPQSNNTVYALVARLKQLGVNLKVAIGAIGYGQETIDDPASKAASQNLTFSVTTQPVEMNTAATKRFQTALVAGGITGAPSYSYITAWELTNALKAGLLKAGQPDPTQADFEAALRSVKDFDDDGLTEPQKVDFSAYSVNSSCSWYVKLVGDKFIPDTGNPYCGTSTTNIS